MKRLIAWTALVAVALMSPHAGLAQTREELDALKKEIEALKAGQTGLRKDLQEIKDLLRQAPQAGQAPTPVQPQVSATARPQDLYVSVEGAPFKGDKNAKVTIIEFTDYQCPFCARHFVQTMPQIDNDYIKTGKVKYVLRDFPLEAIHPQALKAAEAARCAEEQQKYWEMHDRLFLQQRALDPKSLTEHAQALGLDVPRFQQCLDSGKYTAKVRQDYAEGVKAGVRGTPGFFFGLTEPNDSKVKVQKALRGAYSFSAFQGAIDSLLESAK